VQWDYDNPLIEHFHYDGTYQVAVCDKCKHALPKEWISRLGGSGPGADGRSSEARERRTALSGGASGLRVRDFTKGGRINYVTGSISGHGGHRRFIFALIGGNSPREVELIM